MALLARAKTKSKAPDRLLWFMDSSGCLVAMSAVCWSVGQNPLLVAFLTQMNKARLPLALFRAARRAAVSGQ